MEKFNKVDLFVIKSVNPFFSQMVEIIPYNFPQDTKSITNLKFDNQVATLTQQMLLFPLFQDFPRTLEKQKKKDSRDRTFVGRLPHATPINRQHLGKSKVAKIRCLMLTHCRGVESTGPGGIYPRQGKDKQSPVREEEVILLFCNFL